MSNELALANNTTLAIWEDKQSVAEIREVFCPLLTDSEFKAYIGMGKATGLNPFLKEIDAIKYDKTKPANFVIRRDGYRKSAQRNSDYDYHRMAAIYSNDFFENDNGKINHKYKFSDRGTLLGAYCIVKRKNSSEPIYVDVLLSEYDKRQSCWSTMKETMIKKVAEAQALRAAFQELFAGTISEEEHELININEPLRPSKKSNELANRIKAAKGQVIEAEPVEQPQETGESVSTEQLETIHALIAVKVFEQGRLPKALEHYCVERLADLTMTQAEEFIEILNKLADKE
jgi:phage recombination protein Bet